jgi:hypothetical protein
MQPQEASTGRVPPRHGLRRGSSAPHLGPDRFGAIVCARTKAEALTLASHLAQRYGCEDVGVLCPPSVISEVAAAARDAGAQRVVLPALTSSVVLRLGDACQDLLGVVEG